ncbi:GmrSD restriction endonuclease domain-containing protein [Geothrix alkalitolerans]|uniref:GmrSD restriction endonuclease domain-containing protein n=1 Tax=Geothrix alkalitolerans TaxID=2922724 RepID=UPI001FAF8494|nr:DUF262 domain-containing protein [Geothrix alkalitolerans]
MGRPTTLNGWWFDLLVERAEGRVDTLATLLGVNQKTIRRWASGEDRPRDRQLISLREVAGDELFARSDCPINFHPSEDITGGTEENELPLDIEVDDQDDNGAEENLISSDRKIFTEKGDPEVESLKNRFIRGKLDIQPDFQRQFVWDTAKSSRLIESLLLDIPLPVVYLSEEADGRTYVIDGQQRLTSIFSFIDGYYPDDKVFSLSSLKVLSDLNGKKFKDLSEEFQEKILQYKMRTVVFLKDSDKNLKYEIFERLNSGSVSLNDQELRNCIFRGSYNDLIKRLSLDPDFRFLIGEKRPHKRMKDVELVLRFFAFYHYTYLKYRAPMKNFLNRDAEEFRNIGTRQMDELERAFKLACSNVRSIFGNKAFKRFYPGGDSNPNGYWEKSQFNASLYDVCMGVFSQIEKEKVYANLDALREAVIALMSDDKGFIASIELSTSSNQAVMTRFDKFRNVIYSVISSNRKEPRCFSRTLKEEFYSNDSTCAICNNKINDIDDSALDHVRQYWMGGQTIPDNARLTHRYCNWSRPRKE